MTIKILHILTFLVLSILALCMSWACAEITPFEKLISTSTPSPQIEQAKALSGSPISVLRSMADGRESGLVSRVIDGDTIEVLINGASKTIRYIGVDTPETKHPSMPVECFGREASQFNEELVAGKHVLLEKDTTDKDRYGRLLRYVWIEEVRLVNQILVETGYARVSTYPPNVKYESLLIAAESSAQADGIGLWSSCNGQSFADANGVVSGTAQVGDNCSLSYPTLCIPPPPPDLDCRDIGEDGFKVLPPDPHRLDGDRDGTGCER